MMRVYDKRICKGTSTPFTTDFMAMEEQLRAITQQLTDLGASKAPAYSSEEGSDESEVNPFHRQIPRDDHCRQRRWEDRGDDLNLKIEIPEYNGSLRGDDFIEWIEAIECIFEYQMIPNDRKVKIVAMRLRGRASAWWEQIKGMRERRGKRKVT